jgi:hypothetical protein
MNSLLMRGQLCASDVNSSQRDIYLIACNKKSRKPGNQRSASNEKCLYDLCISVAHPAFWYRKRH